MWSTGWSKVHVNLTKMYEMIRNVTKKSVIPTRFDGMEGTGMMCKFPGFLQSLENPTDQDQDQDLKNTVGRKESDSRTRLRTERDGGLRLK